MAERSALNQIVQVGVETTPGTAVTATKRFKALGIEPSVNAEFDKFRPAGNKFITFSGLVKEWTQAAISGRLTYDEIVYALSSVMNTATITTPPGGTNSRKWVFTPGVAGDDSPKTFTCEHGAAGASSNNGRFTYGLVTELGLSFSRANAPELSGTMMGRAYTPNFGTMASAAANATVTPALATHLSAYMDTDYNNVMGTSANNASALMTRLISGEFRMSNKYTPLYVVDQANPGFVAHVDNAPDATLSLMIEANAYGLGLIKSGASTDLMHNGASTFFRLRGLGPLIEGSIYYEFTLDMALKLTGIQNFSDSDGVYAIGLNFDAVADYTWGSTAGKAVEVTCVNTYTAL